MIKTIDDLEEGCTLFINLYEDIVNRTDLSEDLKRHIMDYYREPYWKIKEVMEG